MSLLAVRVRPASAHPTRAADARTAQSLNAINAVVERQRQARIQQLVDATSARAHTVARVSALKDSDVVGAATLPAASGVRQRGGGGGGGGGGWEELDEEEGGGDGQLEAELDQENRAMVTRLQSELDEVRCVAAGARRAGCARR